MGAPLTPNRFADAVHDFVQTLVSNFTFPVPLDEVDTHFKEVRTNTPGRVVRAWNELLSGYAQDPVEILSTTFETNSQEMILARNIDFVSICEHHLLPFRGTVTIGYLPSQNKVVGLSKLPRLVDALSKRLQIQEKLGHEIASAIMENIPCSGVGVVIKSSHDCASIRGVKKTEMEMVTSTLLGDFRKKNALRQEFLGYAL